MGAKTEISWTDATWTPLRARVKSDAGEIATAKGYTSLVQIATAMAGRVGPHCEHVSPGCANCYSGTNNGRCLPANGTGLPFDRRSRDLVDGIVDEKILVQPLHWKAPRKVFVCSQTDLFGEWVTDEQIDRVFAVMALCPQHSFQCLSKRPARMLEYLSDPETPPRIARHMAELGTLKPNSIGTPAITYEAMLTDRWPLSNAWVGVSIENQATADARIPLLLNTPAAVRFVSYEPALGQVDFMNRPVGGCTKTRRNWLTGEFYNVPFTDTFGGGWRMTAETKPRIDWVITGGESGPGARPFDVEWARSAIQQCKAAGVACFVKQFGAKPFDNENREIVDSKFGKVGDIHDRKGAGMDEWPEDLRVREFPEVRA